MGDRDDQRWRLRSAIRLIIQVKVREERRDKMLTKFDGDRAKQSNKIGWMGEMIVSKE